MRFFHRMLILFDVALSVIPLAHACTSTDDRDVMLLQAAKADDVVQVRRLLSNHASVNASQGDGFTALHWAAYNDDPALAALLIRSGSAVEARTRIEGLTPLLLAVTTGDIKLVDLLLAGGADVNKVNDNGTTPLMEAAAAGAPEVVLELLQHGADVHAREKTYQQTALHFAAEHNRAQAIAVLAANGAELNVKSNIQKRDPVPLMIDGVESKRTAAELAEVDAGGERPTQAGESGTQSYAVYLAAPPKKDDRDLFGLSNQERKKRVYGTLRLGGLTALHVAARDGKLQAVHALLDSGADINARTETDRATPLLFALINGHYDVAALLLDRQADTNLLSNDGLGPLYATIDVQWPPHTGFPQPVTAQEKTSYLTLLKTMLAHHADPNARLGRKLWFRVFADNETWIEPTGSTPFWRAALAGDLAAMKLLAQYGADINLPTATGETPLMVAAGLGWAPHWTTDAPFHRLDSVKFCLEHGASVNSVDRKGLTALYGAAFRGDNEMVHFLIDHGADVHVTSALGETAADAANGPIPHSIVHPDTVALLMKLGSRFNKICRSDDCAGAASEDSPAETDVSPVALSEEQAAAVHAKQP